MSKWLRITTFKIHITKNSLQKLLQFPPLVASRRKMNQKHKETHIYFIKKEGSPLSVRLFYSWQGKTKMKHK